MTIQSDYISGYNAGYAAGKRDANPPTEESKVLRSDINKCKQLWQQSLAKWGAPRPILNDEVGIAQAIQLHGAQAVMMALVGSKYEPATDSFNPGQHLSLVRVFDPRKIEKFINLGAAAIEKKRKEKAKEQADQYREENLYNTPINPRALKLLSNFKGYE